MGRYELTQMIKISMYLFENIDLIKFCICHKLLKFLTFTLVRVINYKRNRSKLGLNHVNYAEISLIRFNGPDSLNSEWTHNNQINGQNYRQRLASLKNSAKQKLNRFESISLFLFQTEQIMAVSIVEFSVHGQLNKWETPMTAWV